MKEEWVNTLRNQLGNHTVKAQDGLLDDIKKEMARRGIALSSAPKAKPTAKPSGKQVLAGSAVVAAAVATAYVLWNGSKNTNNQPVAAQKMANVVPKTTLKQVEKNNDGSNQTASEGPLATQTPAGEDLFVPFADAPFTAPAESTADHLLMPDDMAGELPSSAPTSPVDVPRQNPTEKPIPQQPENEPQHPDNIPDNQPSEPVEPQQVPQNRANQPAEAPSAPKQMPRRSIPLFSFGFGSANFGFKAPTTTTAKTITIAPPYTDQPGTETQPADGGNTPHPNPGEGSTGSDRGSTDHGHGSGTHDGGGKGTTIEGDHKPAKDDPDPTSGTASIAGEGNQNGGGEANPNSFEIATRATRAGGIPASTPTQAQEVRTVKHNQPIRMGFTFAIPLSSRMNLITGFTYNYLSSDITVTSPLANTVQKQKLYYLGIPVSVNYNFFSWKGFSVYGIAGGGVEKLVKGKLTGTTTISEGAKTQTSTTIKETRPQFSVNASVGASYNFWGIMSAYIEPGVIYYFDNGSGVDNFYKANKTAFNLNVGLRLNLFK